jgi:lipopolysaccharide/colanic/teichoic acid biosynthesis glycosyltransferase
MKRFFDVLIAGMALAIFSFPILLIAWMIRLRLGSPVLFHQLRPGLHGKPFEMFKFRTMREVIDASGRALPDIDRITPFGEFLRSTSLDELPELWNVLKGEMSLVGPRPLLMEYIPLYTLEQACRHNVLPGITGWAQINGRNTLTWEDKFLLDVWYVNNHSFWLDIKILLLTVIKVLGRNGISAQGEITMPRFTGNQVLDKK